MHTPKAVRKGLPGDRLFVVHNGFKEGRRTWYNAWKGRLTSQGLIHPAFKDALPINEVTLGKLGKVPDLARNGAEPTAQFYKDSFYREVTWDAVRAICAAQPGVEAPITQNVQLRETKLVTHLEYSVRIEDRAGTSIDPVKLAAIRRLMTKLHENLEALV